LILFCAESKPRKCQHIRNAPIQYSLLPGNKCQPETRTGQRAALFSTIGLCQTGIGFLSKNRESPEKGNESSRIYRIVEVVLF